MDPEKDIPYSEEAKLASDIVEFIFHKVPHSISEAWEHMEEGALAASFVEDLSALTDQDLSEGGLHRDDISEVSAAAAKLFKVANNRAKQSA